MQSLTLKPFSLVVAVSRNNGIGNQGKLPWPYIPKEMRHFVEITSSLEDMAYS